MKTSVLIVVVIIIPAVLILASIIAIAVVVSRLNKSTSGRDIELNYIEAGEGKPFILLHGNGGSSKYFFNQIDYFSKKYHMYAIDTRGQGNSKRGVKPYIFEQFAEDLHDFMVDKGIQKAHILGYSDGGNIAIAFANKYQDMIDKLILNSANLSPEGVYDEFQIPTVKSYEKMSKKLIKSGKLKRKLERYNLMVNAPSFSDDMIKGIGVATLVIAGDEDIIKSEHTRHIYELLPQGRLKFLSGTHSVAKGNPMEFNREVEEFLGDD